MQADVVLDFEFNHSVDKVWEALTNSEEIAQWIFENNLEPKVGHKFNFKSEPNEYWDGIIIGEVLSIDKPRLFSYSMGIPGETTTVVWTLDERDDGGTKLHFEQSGFSEETKAYEGAIEGAKSSWEDSGRRLKEHLNQKYSS